jgi:hypothetical protein
MNGNHRINGYEKIYRQIIDLSNELVQYPGYHQALELQEKLAAYKNEVPKEVRDMLNLRHRRLENMCKRVLSGIKQAHDVR